MKMPALIWALALGTFAIGAAEFVISGLLPLIAEDFSISVPQAGHMATSYALGVFAGAPLMIVIGERLSRKSLMLLLIALFVAGSLITAASPFYGGALAGRVVTALAHGAFIGTGAIIAGELVEPSRRTSAIAFMFTGMTLANLFGVPGGLWIGNEISWRATFYVIALIGIAAAFGIAATMPNTPRHEKISFRREIRAFADPQVLLAMGITIFGPAAFFTSITYISPMATQVAGYSDAGVTGLLFLFGLGLVIGNIVGGRLADRALMPLLLTTLGAQAIVLFLFYLLAANAVAAAVCVFLMAAFGFASVSPIQQLVLDKARAAGGANLASAINIGMFNVGNALGAYVGGHVIAAGYGYAAPNWAGGLFSAIALILAAISAVFGARRGLSGVNP